MATNLHIDDALLAKAVKAGGGKSKRETVNQALAEYVQHRLQLEIIKVFGTLEDDDFWQPPIVKKPGRSSGRNGAGRNGKHK